MVKTGDIVRFLNTTGGGRVTKIENGLAYVEDEDGFETPVLLREVVVVAQPAAEPARQTAAPAVAPKMTPSAPQPAPAPAIIAEPEIPVEETPGGDKVNLVLAYEPTDIKQLGSTTYDAYIVNDSNYYLYFTYLTRADETEQWSVRYAGMVEPNIQLWIGEVNREDLPAMDRVAVQYVAFKRDKEFDLKKPVSVEMALDTTKFFRLHCFRTHTYFDTPVIALDLVTDDQPYTPVKINPVKIEEAIRQKKEADRPTRRPVKKRNTVSRRDENIVVDLHVGELLDTTAGLSPADILNLQIDEFRRVMDENRNHKGQKIIFIHGKGEGVLRQAILKELNHRYKGNQVQDASFREYGFGATQVTIR